MNERFKDQVILLLKVPHSCADHGASSATQDANECIDNIELKTTQAKETKSK